jgi:hypothetical protein
MKVVLNEGGTMFNQGIYTYAPKCNALTCIYIYIYIYMTHLYTYLYVNIGWRARTLTLTRKQR